MSVIAFDCETHLIAPGSLAPPLVCVTFAGDPSMPKIRTRDNARPFVVSMFETADVIAGANTAYDAAVCLAAYPEIAPALFEAYADDRIVDVQLNEKLADIARGRLDGYTDGHGVYRRTSYALAALVQRYTGKDRTAQKVDPEGWRMRYAELDGVPLDRWPEAALAYAIEDADDTLAVLEAQEPIGHLWLPDAAAQARASFALHLLSCWGIQTDPEAIDALERMTRGRWEDLTRELQREGLIRSNGTRDTKKAKARIVDVCIAAGLPVAITEAGEKLAKERGGAEHLTRAELYGVASLDVEACEASLDPVLERYAERVSLGTIVETHIPDLRKGTTTPIQASWGLAESGRVTCSKGRGGSTNGFQLTNPSRSLVVTCPACVGRGCEACGGKGEITSPHDVRACFKARTGYLYVDADFSGLELSTVAQACRDLVGFSALGDAINAGIDPHLQLGGRMMGISYAEAVARKHEKIVKHHRQLAKVANFGFPGGLGARGFVAFARGYGVKGMTLDEAKGIKADWLAAWPEFSAYFAHVAALSEGNGTAEIVQLRSGRIRGLVPYTAACNTYFQGLGADGAKAALWEVTRRCYDPAMGSILYGCRPVNFVHDQIIAEVPEEYAHECAVEIGRVMVEACNRYLPDVPVSCSPCLSSRWCKDAEAVFDATGRMVAWDRARDAGAVVYYADGKQVAW